MRDGADCIPIPVTHVAYLLFLLYSCAWQELHKRICMSSGVIVIYNIVIVYLLLLNKRLQQNIIVPYNSIMIHGIEAYYQE